MKNLKKFTLVLLLVFVLFTAVGCKKDKDEPFEKGEDGMAKLTYPDLPHTGNEKNSWEYIENESLKIKWYVDTSTWNAPSGIDAISAKIKEKTGITTNIVRFPGGIASSRYLRNSITEELRNMGYGWVDWTASNGDGGYVANGTTAMNNLKNTINEDIEVILFHDYSYVTLSILPEAIEYLRNNNYVLLPLFYESRMINK